MAAIELPWIIYDIMNNKIRIYYKGILKVNRFSLLTIFIAVGTSIACQVGDLFFSYLKRKAKIKDTGNILPGHGGILDRFDGILLGLPFGFILIALYLSWKK